MSMRSSAGRQMMGLARLLVLSVLTFTLCMAGADLRRKKRDWEWKFFFVTEEADFPQKIGKRFTFSFELLSNIKNVKCFMKSRDPFMMCDTYCAVFPTSGVLVFQLSSNKSNANTIYVIEGEGANTIFEVNQHGDLNVNKKLDRETKSEYKLKAQLIDKTTKEVVDGQEDFVIRVNDINDNFPVFPTIYKGSVDERSPKGTVVFVLKSVVMSCKNQSRVWTSLPSRELHQIFTFGTGTKVLTVTATDADDPTTGNGKVGYMLKNGTDLFDIDPQGVIRTKVDALDREKQNMYLIVVEAKDMPGFQAGNIANTTVTINVADINDNMAVFKTRHFTFDVKEDQQKDFEIGVMEIEDKDEEQNKDPSFTMDSGVSRIFEVVTNQRKDGVLILKEALDYETKSKHTFVVYMREDTLRSPADNQGEASRTQVEVVVNVLDVNEPPVFTQQMYNFSLREDARIGTRVGKVSARDPDTAQYDIRYMINDRNCPVVIDWKTGDMKLQKELDREHVRSHPFHVIAEEITPEGLGLKSHVIVNLEVLDVNDNRPELFIYKDLFVCENDRPGTVLDASLQYQLGMIGMVSATDRDDHKHAFSFSLAQPSANFSLVDNKDNTANISVLQGGFEADGLHHYMLMVMVVDGGSPQLSSNTTVFIPVCKCGENRESRYCRPAKVGASVSFHALIAIILCILTILVINNCNNVVEERKWRRDEYWEFMKSFSSVPPVIVILIVLRKRYQKEALVTLGKNSGEIHEQLVTYDEEGGGEMDTNGYDVSVLTSARNDGSFVPIPAMYAVVKKPTAARGDMAAMIDVKKDEADHDRDGYPYDTLHIYGYEGPESLAGSLSSLETSSDDSNLDYDFLNDWGPRFKTLAQLYGVDSLDDGYLY
ncbi:cadherin-5-like [Scleropages formosus]|uniref:Cadherin-5 n=1 Tax=Scleropages formosus TaxID=113540 RepID=A0A0N8JZ16_SCLFO|nr:cadherin-5-like [Scleropages formosus]